MDPECSSLVVPRRPAPLGSTFRRLPSSRSPGPERPAESPRRPMPRAAPAPACAPAAGSPGGCDPRCSTSGIDPGRAGSRPAPGTRSSALRAGSTRRATSIRSTERRGTPHQVARVDGEGCRREERKPFDAAPEGEGAAGREVRGGETRGDLEEATLEARAHESSSVTIRWDASGTGIAPFHALPPCNARCSPVRQPREHRQGACPLEKRSSRKLYAATASATMRPRTKKSSYCLSRPPAVRRWAPIASPVRTRRTR